MFQENGTNESGIDTLKPDKINFSPKNRREKGCHFVFTNGRTHQEDITILNMHIVHSGVSSVTKQIQINRKCSNCGDFSTPFSPTDKNETEAYWC